MGWVGEWVTRFLAYLAGPPTFLSQSLAVTLLFPQARSGENCSHQHTT